MKNRETSLITHACPAARERGLTQNALDIGPYIWSDNQGKTWWIRNPKLMRARFCPSCGERLGMKDTPSQSPTSPGLWWAKYNVEWTIWSITGEAPFFNRKCIWGTVPRVIGEPELLIKGDLLKWGPKIEEPKEENP